ncbi:hypothetical protein JVU11DRAFT_10172 [Chiua virens]|nr:hypothetical protein JVU11DRAFT_10172 [Chiua virens]
MSYNNTFGAYLIGVVVSAALYGGLSQIRFHDTLVFQLAKRSHLHSDLVLLWSLSFGPVAHQAPGRYRSYIRHLPSSFDHALGHVQSFVIKHHIHPPAAYTYLVTDIANPAGLGLIVWSLIVEVIFNGFTAFFVQSFLAMRVYRLSNKSLLATGSVMILVVGEFVLVLVYAYKALHLATFVELTTLKPISMAVNAVAAAGDVLIAIFLCFMLQRSRTGFRRSDTMINKLILFSINTGLLTSICAVASLISIAASSDTFIYIAFYFCLGRLYCNSLLATLNARKGLRGESREEEMSLSLQGVQQKTTTSMVGVASKRAPNNISIKIDTTQEYVRDEYSASSGDLKSPQVV